jgi:hypothetical protein
MSYPDSRDHREIVLNSTSESATGQERKETWNFSFDRVIPIFISCSHTPILRYYFQVFEPQCTQEEVFEEISQLAQSCTDGYNVCIFAYGQTGSGKSFTMEGGSVSALHAHAMTPIKNTRLEDNGDRGYDTPRRRPSFPSHRRTEKQGVGICLEGQFLEIVRISPCPLIRYLTDPVHSITKPSMTSSEKVSSTRRSTRSSTRKGRRASPTS